MIPSPGGRVTAGEPWRARVCERVTCGAALARFAALHAAAAGAPAGTISPLMEYSSDSAEASR